MTLSLKAIWNLHLVSIPFFFFGKNDEESLSSLKEGRSYLVARNQNLTFSTIDFVYCSIE